ncbi:MAG TPA: Lrp/AsnC family transcriptional regulator [Terricaulis sp.]|nr:Lrp/AsnC family transcriptional regulator [Terricaulis sp.]
MGAAKTESATKALRANEEKWGKPLMDAGWTAMPSVIIEHQRALGLDAIDVNILMHLAMYWWKAENLPRPAKTTIAEALQIHPRTVQRRIASLEKAGLIQRHQRRTNAGSRPNLYDFTGLIREATPFAQQKIQKRAKQREEQAKTAAQRGRPKLVIDNEEGT